jgi:signal transduction histidine kinase
MTWLRRHADVAIALVVFVVTAATNPIGGLSIVFAAVACGVLVLRRHFPFTTFLVSAVFAEAFLVVDDDRRPGALILAAPLIGLYTVAEATSRRRALTIGVAAILTFAVLHIWAKPYSLLGGDNLALAALGGLAIAAGDGARSRREYLVEVQTKAAADAVRRITDERLRIARDLHDAVGHQLALINVQASVAAHVLDTSPSSARVALGHVREASKTALGDLRDTIGLLRQPGDQPPTEPTPGLSGLDELLSSFRGSGLDIEPAAPHDLGHVPVPIDLTAYRVIQEALTNVCKHAGPTRVRVTTTRRGDALCVVVDNSPPSGGTPRSAEPGGHGLLGMRERTEALGGALEAGPRPDGGYRVRATLPLDPTP